MTQQKPDLPSVAIVGAIRTPLGGFRGCLKDLTCTDLGSIAISGALAQSQVPANSVQEVIMGCVLPAGLGQAPTRHASLKAGLPESAGCTTINKICGSGMKAAMLAHDLIVASSNNIMVAGGMESMSNAPTLIPVGTEFPIESKENTLNHMFYDGLQDGATHKLMGAYAQVTADDKGYTREQQDAFAVESLTRAKTAITKGAFTNEITPVTVGDQTIKDDEQPLKANPEKIPQLKAAFAENGTITAANASSISDGAAALVLAHRQSVEEHQLKPIAYIKAHTTFSQHPSLFTTAPVGAINKLLEKTGWKKEEVDLWEINEAFAMVTMIAIDELALDPAKVNINGGACALGHPIGASGCRIIVSLIYALQERGLKRGIASLCIGGGEATAIAIEMV